MLLLLSHIWYFWNSLFWESFWHKVDFCRSVTYFQGEGWIPFLPTCPLTYGAQYCQHAPDKPEEGLLCHRAVEQPNSMQNSKMPYSADAIPPQMLTLKGKELRSHHSEKRDNPECSSSSACQPRKLNPVFLSTHLHVWFASCSPVLITHIDNTLFFTDRAKVLKTWEKYF